MFHVPCVYNINFFSFLYVLKPAYQGAGEVEPVSFHPGCGPAVSGSHVCFGSSALSNDLQFALGSVNKLESESVLQL